MKEQNTIYTGQLTYKDVNFTFVFDGKELRLIPPEDKWNEIAENWLGTPIAKGVSALHKPAMQATSLCGFCNETNQKLIFIVRSGSYVTIRGNYLSGGNFVLIVNVIAYVVCKHDRKTIDRISFTSPEIDAVHPINRAFNISFGSDSCDFDKNGVLSITTKDFNSTTTEPQKFIVDNKKVTAYFSVWRGISTAIGEAPISLYSCLMFEFEATDDYEFIMKLWHIAKNFLSYLCYRRNVFLQAVKLAAPFADGTHEEFATLYVVGEDGSPSIEDIKGGRYIKQILRAYSATREK